MMNNYSDKTIKVMRKAMPSFMISICFNRPALEEDTGKDAEKFAV